MKLHANARTCPRSRRLAVDRVGREGWTLTAAAEAAGVSVRTVSKWRRRYREEGEQGLLDRCSAPSLVPSRTCEQRIALIAGLRRLRMTAAEIAEVLAMPVSTISGILTRSGLGRLSRLEPDRAGQPLREAAAGGARPCRCQEARHDRAARPPCHRPGRRRRPSPARLRPGLGIRARLCRRRDPTRLRRSPRRRESPDRGWLPPPRGRPLRRLRHPGRAGDDR